MAHSSVFFLHLILPSLLFWLKKIFSNSLAIWWPKLKQIWRELTKRRAAHNFLCIRVYVRGHVHVCVEGTSC